jgi:hypothetical protein
LAASAIACGTIILFTQSAGADNYPPLEPLINQGLTTAPPGFPGLYWNLSGGLSAPLIDENGKVTFSGRIFGDGITTQNNRLFWTGDANGWTVVARNSETLPGLPGGVTLLVPSDSSFNVSANGMVMVSSTLQGAGVVTTNDTAFWYGAPSSLALAAREGDQITPGGALINSAMTLSGSRVNNAGQVLIPTNLTGGDTVTANNTGIFLYGPGGYTKVWRKGDPIPGAPALPANDGPFMTPSLFTLNMNSSGAVAYTGTLVAGTAGGVATTDDAVMAVTDGAGVTRIIAREDALYAPLCGDTDPKNPGGEFTVRYRRTSSFTPATRSINNAGKVLFNGMVEGVTGDHGVTTANDTVWLLDSGSGDPQIVLREGQDISGLTFNLVNLQAIMLNNNDRMAFAGTASDGGPTVSCLWTGPAGGPYTLIAKTGDALPGSTDVFLAPNISNAALTFNNADQVIFNCDVTGPGVTVGVNDRTIMGWDPVQGLKVIARSGVTTLPNILDVALLSLPGTTYQTGDGGCSYFTDNGWLTFRLQDLKGFNAIVRCRPFDPVNDCPADTNGDNEVNVTDLLAVIAAWGATGTNAADINDDLVVNVTDLLAVIAAWGSCP